MEEAAVTLFGTKTKNQRNSTKKKSYSTEIWYDSCLKEVQFYNYEETAV